MDSDKTLILKTLVGSQAHGLASVDSDFDYRGVYVEATSKILSLGYKSKGCDWIEGNQDNTSYEISHFLHLATKCNPSILEVFMAPDVTKYDSLKNAWAGVDLKALFPHVWNPKGAFNAFVGYGHNQRKKMLDKKDSRERKYAVAYLRTLQNLYDLLTTGKFSLEIKDEDFKDELHLLKYGTDKLNTGYVINRAEQLVEKCEKVLPLCNHEPDIEKVHEFLMKIRREYW